MSNQRISEKRKKKGFPSWQLVFILMGGGISLFRWYVRIEPQKMEYGYSRAIYPFIADMLSWTGKMVPVPYSASELFICLISIWIFLWSGWSCYRVIRQKGSFFGFLAKSALNMTALIAGGYFFFLTAWGFNYLRQPFFVSLNQDMPMILESDDYEALAKDMVDLANRLYLSEKKRPDMIAIQKADEAVDRAVRKVIEKTSPSRIPLPPPVKFLLNNYLFNMFSASGLFLPIFMEPHINADLLLWEMPVTIAHEKAHFMGFASETDANLIAYIACLSSDTDMLKYSAALNIIISLHAYLPPEKWQILIKESVSQAVQEDIKARRERIQNSQERYGRLYRMGRKFYDTYLKSNSQKTGINSYQAAIPQFAIWWREYH